MVEMIQSVSISDHLRINILKTLFGVSDAPKIRQKRLYLNLKVLFRLLLLLPTVQSRKRIGIKMCGAYLPTYLPT